MNEKYLRHVALQGRVEANLVAATMLVAHCLDEGIIPEPYRSVVADLAKLVEVLDAATPPPF